MTAGDIGPQIVIDAGGYNLLGSTCTLLAAPGRANLQGPRALALEPVTIAQDGLTASYAQAGTDFQQGGFWRLQLRVFTLDGQTLWSAPRKFYVFPRLS